MNSNGNSKFLNKKRVNELDKIYDLKSKEVSKFKEEKKNYQKAQHIPNFKPKINDYLQQQSQLDNIQTNRDSNVLKKPLSKRDKQKQSAFNFMPQNFYNSKIEQMKKQSKAKLIGIDQNKFNQLSKEEENTLFHFV